MLSLLGVLYSFSLWSRVLSGLVVKKSSLFMSSMACSILYVWIISPILLRYAKGGKFRCFSLSMYTINYMPGMVSSVVSVCLCIQ